MAIYLLLVSSLLINIATSHGAEAPCKLLNDGNLIPIVALGTGRVTAAGKSNEEVRDAVLWAIEAGYRHIDTAAAYGDEVEVGQGIADAIDKGLVTREHLFVTTKLWNNRHARDQVVPALKESLGKLGLDYVDLYLIHFPIATKDDDTFDYTDYLETWQGMEQAKEMGLVRSIGVSNFNISQIDRLYANSKIKPALNQFEVNPTMTQQPLVSHCHSLGLQVMAYSPFGYVVSRNTPDAPPPRYDDPTLVSIADKYKKTVGQVLLRYLVDRGLIPIPKSTNKARLAQNIDLFDFQLTDAEVDTISAFNKNVRVIDLTGFEKHPYYPFQ